MHCDEGNVCVRSRWIHRCTQRFLRQARARLFPLESRFNEATGKRINEQTAIMNKQANLLKIIERALRAGAQRFERSSSWKCHKHYCTMTQSTWTNYSFWYETNKSFRRRENKKKTGRKYLLNLRSQTFAFSINKIFKVFSRMNWVFSNVSWWHWMRQFFLISMVISRVI